MEGKAHVASIEALEDFRAALIVYLERANRVLDDLRHEVATTRTWIESDRHRFWKTEIRKRQARLVQAQQELLTARISEHPGAIQDRRMAVQRARAELEKGEAALGRIKAWLRQYDREVEHRLRATFGLSQFLAHDLKMGVSFLDRSITTLSEYAGMRVPGPAGAAKPGEEEATAGEGRRAGEEGETE